MDRVVITGMGLVCALGQSLTSTWPRLIAGESGIRRISHFDPTDYDCQVAAEAHPALLDTGLTSIPARYLRRGAKLFLQSALEAWDAARLPRDRRPKSRYGIAVGASINYVHLGWLLHQHGLLDETAGDVSLTRFATDGCVPDELFSRYDGDSLVRAPATILGLAGPASVNDTACAASLFALGEAFQRLRRGEVDVMLAGGGIAVVNPLGVLSFSLLRALSKNTDPQQASRPFDLHRDGFVMGEAGAALVLERAEHARDRGAPIYAEVAGFGTSMSAVNLTDPSPDGSAEARAMRLALADAGVEVQDIGYVAAHGTSTKKNDLVETRAIRSVLGRHADHVPVSSNKGQLGHTISAAGACNLICAVKAIQDGVVPPTANLRTADPQCDLDYVPLVGRAANVEAALCNAFAFGGQNACMVARRFEGFEPC